MPRVDVPEYKTFIDFPDGTPPAEMQQALTTSFPPKRGIVDTIAGAGARLAQGVNSTAGGMLDAFGMEKGAEAYKQGADYWAKKAEARGSSGIPAKIYEGIGGAPLGVAEFVAGVPYAAVKGGLEGFRKDGALGAVQGAGTEALKRFGIGKVFKGIEGANLTPVQRSATMAGTMGVQTAAEGGSLEDVVAATATGAALMPPTGGGRSGVVRQRMQAAGALPEVAADLAGRGAADAVPRGMGGINVNNVDTVYSADVPPRPAVNNSEQMPGTESFRQQTRGPVLDAENPSRLSPYDATGPSPGLSMEVARTKVEHPFWSDAEVWTEAQRTALTHNPEVVPPATDMSTVRPVSAPERPAEQAPSRTVEAPSMENFNHDSLPTATVKPADSLVVQDAAPHLKIVVVGTPTEIKALGPQPVGKMVWRDGDKAYVIDIAAARDKYGSLTETKRALRAGGDVAGEALGYPERGDAGKTMTVYHGSNSATPGVPDASGNTHYFATKSPARLYGKVVAEKVPVNNPMTVNAGGRLKGEWGNYEDSIAEARAKGHDALIIKNIIDVPMEMEEGYYKDRLSKYRSDVVIPIKPEMNTAAVTKQGEVLTEPAAIREAATAGEVAYAAEGRPAELAAKIEPVAEALKTTDLHAGIHLPTLVKQAKDLITHYTKKLDTDAPAGSVKAFLDSNREANRTFGVKPIIATLRRAIVDSSANVQNELMQRGPQGEFVRRQFDSISGASAKAQLAVEKQREALSGMSLREQQAMGDMIAIDRDLSISRYRGAGYDKEISKSHVKTIDGTKYNYNTKETAPDSYTLIGGKSAAELSAARKTFQQDYKLTDAEMHRVDAATRQYFDAWKQNTQRMLDAGLIDAKQKTKLDSHEYSPKQFLDKIDPDIPGLSGKITVPDSGIAKLKQGSDGYFRSNPMRLLSEATARIETRIARNEANQALASLPAGNGIWQAAKRIGPKNEWSKAPAGFEAVHYMSGGKQQTIHMRSDLAAEWAKSEPLMAHQLVTALQWVSGAKLVRAAATGYNPAFIFTNVPRDLVTIWMQAERTGYSKHAPVAVAEMASDLKRVARDAWSRKGRYLDYVNEGGGRELLTHEGALSSRRENLGPALAKVQRTLSYVNEFSEILTRLAYRERMIKNGMDPATASKAAAEYVDFSRGGTVVKAIDRMGIPYLNAAIQGTRAVARAAGRDPAAFAYKTAQMIVGVSGLYAINQMINPEGLANVSDRDKANNFIIMLPKHFEYVDKNGTTVSPYLKISKEQSMRPFATLSEMATALAHGEKPTSQQIQMALGAASPVAIDKMPPTMAALWTYLLNADTYTKEPVWKGKQEIEPYAEYTANTNPILRDLGAATATDGEGGLSPDRMAASLNKIVPSTNMYAQLAGNALTDIYEKIKPPERAELQRANYEKLRSVPGVARILGGAADTNQFREGIREARVSANTEAFETNKTLDAMVLRYAKTGSNDAALYDRIAAHVAKQPEAVQERMEKRIEMLAETANLPDRGWWMSTRALQPEDRAEQFKARYDKAPPDEQQRMLEIADGLKGYVSERFMDKWESK